MIEQQIHIQEIESSQEIEEDEPDEPDETLETLERRTPTENFRLEFLFLKGIEEL